MTKQFAGFPDHLLAADTAPTPVQAIGLGPNPTPEELEAFYRAPPPPGRSRESRIVLDAEGRFSQDGAPFDHHKLAAAFHKWIARHPDDGRYILTNGLDWSYFTVEDAPYFVRQLTEREGEITLMLSDGSEEVLHPAKTRVGKDGALYTQVKAGAFEAKFSRHAQTALAPYLVELEGQPALRLAGTLQRIG
jgi:hypothetical protein